MKIRKRTIRSKSGRGKPYRTPQLSVLGNLRRLTKVKGGNMGDGGGKPSTKSGGMSA